MLNKQELLKYIKHKVESVENSIDAYKNQKASIDYLLGLRQGYLDIYDKLVSAEPTEEDKIWAEEVISKVS
jgi:hypothetical protein